MNSVHLPFEKLQSPKTKLFSTIFEKLERGRERLESASSEYDEGSAGGFRIGLEGGGRGLRRKLEAERDFGET